MTNSSTENVNGAGKRIGRTIQERHAKILTKAQRLVALSLEMSHLEKEIDGAVQFGTISEFSSHSFIVCLPKKWVKEFGLVAHTKVLLERKENGIFVHVEKSSDQK